MVAAPFDSCRNRQISAGRSPKPGLGAEGCAYFPGAIWAIRRVNTCQYYRVRPISRSVQIEPRDCVRRETVSPKHAIPPFLGCRAAASPLLARSMSRRNARPTARAGATEALGRRGDATSLVRILAINLRVRCANLAKEDSSIHARPNAQNLAPRRVNSHLKTNTIRDHPPTQPQQTPTRSPPASTSSQPETSHPRLQTTPSSHHPPSPSRLP
jgi:hypothetical protein